MCKRRLSRRLNSIPPHRPERVAAFLGKITRNVSLNRWKQYNAQKRGEGQTELALSELEECIPAKTGIEQAVEDELYPVHREIPLLPAEVETKSVYSPLLVYKLHPGAGGRVRMSESKVKSLLFRMRKNLNTILQRRISYYEKRKIASCYRHH